MWNVVIFQSSIGDWIRQKTGHCYSNEIWVEPLVGGYCLVAQSGRRAIHERANFFRDTKFNFYDFELISFLSGSPLSSMPFMCFKLDSSQWRHDIVQRLGEMTGTFALAQHSRASYWDIKWICWGKVCNIVFHLSVRVSTRHCSSGQCALVALCFLLLDSQLLFKTCCY